MTTIVSFYQHFPDDAPPLNLSVFDHAGYTYAENFRRNERCYEAEQCEVTSDDGSAVLSLDVRVRPRGGEIEALPRLVLSVYSEGAPLVVRRMELCAGDAKYTIQPDYVQQYTLRGDHDGGYLETMAIPLGKVGMKMLREASDAAEARWVIQGARTMRTMALTSAQKKAIHRFCMDCEEAAITDQPAFLWYKDYCTKA